MPNCLVIDNATGLVINRIVANPDFDPAPDGCRLELELILPAEPTIEETIVQGNIDSQTPAMGG
jgi:hypothetical protein